MVSPFLSLAQRAVLPQNGRRVGERALQALVTAAQRAVAELQTLFKDRPELFNVAAGGAVPRPAG